MQVNVPIVCKPGELRCGRCFSRDVAPCIPTGILDAIMARFVRIPKICRFCGKRFYVREGPPVKDAAQ